MVHLLAARLYLAPGEEVFLDDGLDLALRLDGMMPAKLLIV
jgi:hypothetical protein